MQTKTNKTADQRVTELKKNAVKQGFRYLQDLTNALDKVKNAPAYSQQEQDALADLLLLRMQADRAYTPIARYGEVVSALLEME